MPHSLTVLALRIHPAKDEPGVPLEQVVVDAAGLQGDRRKKAPVHLVGTDATDVRANIVLDVPSAELTDLVGHTITIGDLVLGIIRPAGNCPGVYADVRHPGTVAIGAKGIAG